MIVSLSHRCNIYVKLFEQQSSIWLGSIGCGRSQDMQNKIEHEHKNENPVWETTFANSMTINPVSSRIVGFSCTLTSGISG